MNRVTNGKTDKVLSKLLVNNSFKTVEWMSKREWSLLQSTADSPTKLEES